MQIVFLLFKTPPGAVPADAILERAQELTGTTIEHPEPEEGDQSVLMFVHPDHITELEDGSIPGQTFIMSMEEGPEADKMVECVQQSWNCDDAEMLLNQSTFSLGVTEMMCNGLEPEDRLKLFHGVLRATVELTGPHAMVFTHTKQIIRPEQYLDDSEVTHPMARAGLMNVRTYSVSNGEAGDTIMDLLGLDAIGLHDLQCHYRGLEPQEVARMLLNTGAYIYDQGPVIESGQTVDGITPGSRWVCQFEESILEPKRDILDINPGPPHAAGRREPAGGGSGGGLLGRIGRLFGRG